MSGFYLIHRGWMDNPVFSKATHREPLCRRAAWVWLIENARYEDGSVMIAGKRVELSRGQLSCSYRYLGAAWGWPESKVRRFFVGLTEAKMIECATDARQAVITICNYDKYQVVGRAGDAPTDAEPTQNRRRTDANIKEGKEGNISSEAKASSAPSAPARDLASGMVEVWRAECGDILPIPNKLDPSRVAACAARWRDTFGRDFEQWRAYCQAIRGSPFCCGDNERGWRADFDWALKPKSIRGVQEGKYERASGRGKGAAVDNLVEGFGRAAGLRNGSADIEPDWSASDPLLYGEHVRFDA